MESLKQIKTEEDALKLLNIALEHEWAVSFEYTVHAYSMPKATFFYEDPIMQTKTDAHIESQTHMQTHQQDVRWVGRLKEL